MNPGPVIVATDLTEHARPAILQGSAHASRIGAPLIVCHVVLDVFRSHPLLPDPAANELVIELNVVARALELASQQVASVLGSADGVRIVVEPGEPDEEIVRLAERERASLIAVGAKPRKGTERVLGHVAERVVRYAHGSVLVARETPATGKILVATDFTEGSLPALRAAQTTSRDGGEVTLLHVVTLPSSLWSSALMPLGDTWAPPPKAAIDELEALGLKTLESLAKEYGFARFEQIYGTPADAIVERAESLGADMIVVGSHGRKGLARLVLGSVAEKVIRASHCSVFVAREPVTPAAK
jgi:nucleotide-binding universal stress UspA family protein